MQYQLSNPTVPREMYSSSICHRCCCPHNSRPGERRDPSRPVLEQKLKGECHPDAPDGVSQPFARFKRTRAVSCCMNSLCGADFAGHDETGGFGIVLCGVSSSVSAGMCTAANARIERIVPRAYAATDDEVSDVFRLEPEAWRALGRRRSSS